LDPDVNQDEEEEKRRLINQVLELQNTLDGEPSSFSEYLGVALLAVVCSSVSWD